MERFWNAAVANLGNCGLVHRAVRPTDCRAAATTENQGQPAPPNCHTGGRGFESRRLANPMQSRRFTHAARQHEWLFNARKTYERLRFRLRPVGPAISPALEDVDDR